MENLTAEEINMVGWPYSASHSTWPSTLLPEYQLIFLISICIISIPENKFD